MKKIDRRDALKGMCATIGGTLAGCAMTQATGQKRRRPPNIIFILTDDLGYGDLGCYGQERIQTPHIDRMASEGIRFTQCYAGSTVCAPSRCCLMTGRHTGHAYVRGNKRVPLPPEEVTVAELLKDAGYATGLVGKWGLGEPDTTGVPNRQGFDYFFGYLNQGRAHNYYPEYLWRNEEQYPLEGNVEDPEHPQVSLERKQYSHDLFAQEALDFVEKHQAEPFFLYLALTIPHANNERGRVMGDGMEVPSYESYADEDWPQPMKGHAAMITRMDRDVGRLLRKLRELGLDEDTVVFFTSDNGPHKEGGADPSFFDSSGPLRGFKRDLYDGGIRVPMIVRWPGTVAAGGESDLPWAFWDFLRTAADLAGVDSVPPNDGISVAPTLLGTGEQPQHEYLYWEFHERGFQQAVRMDQWKAVRTKPGEPVELYDVTQDLAEAQNLADAHPDVVARAENCLASAHTESEHWPVKQPK